MHGSRGSARSPTVSPAERTLVPHAGVRPVTGETASAGNVDEVVVAKATGPDDYVQVKATVSAERAATIPFGKAREEYAGYRPRYRAPVRTFSRLIDTSGISYWSASSRAFAYSVAYATTRDLTRDVSTGRPIQGSQAAASAMTWPTVHRSGRRRVTSGRANSVGPGPVSDPGRGQLRWSCSLPCQACHGLPQGVCERVAWWQGLFAAGEGVAQQGCRVGEAARGEVGVRQVRAGGQGVRMIGAENLLVAGAGLLVELQRGGDLARGVAGGGEATLGGDRVQ